MRRAGSAEPSFFTFASVSKRQNPNSGVGVYEEEFKKMKRIIALLCSITLLCAALLVGMPTAQAATDGMVRVWLKSMDYYGSIQSVSITLNGSYSIPTAPDVVLSTRGTYSIEVVGGTLMISGTGIDTPVDVGSKFTIKQHKNDDGSIGTISLYNNKYGTRSYRGDMNFDISGGSLRLINKVYIEDYLYGVLAGELSNTFPLETLKAQAIIARSYVYNRMTGREPNYEINDTSGDQVYKGYNASNNVIMKAVDETAGMLLKYNGSVVNAYFGASNGGQIELPGNAWSKSSSLGCYVMRDDPYDVRNPMSRTVPYTFTSDPNSLDTGFYTLIQEKVYKQLGYYPTIKSIQSVSLSNPVETDRRSVGVSRNYQTMNMTVLVSDGSIWGGGGDGSNVYDDTWTGNSGTGTSQSVDISISLHNELKYVLFSADSDLRLFKLETSGNYYYLTLARYGHGVGMSQRGAQQMAKEGESYKSIINFYFDGVSLPTIDFKREELTRYMPIATKPIAQATVTSSTLRVRSDASSSSAKLGTLSRGTTVDVYANLGDWLCVSFNGSMGYISASYVTLTDYDGSEVQPTSTPDNGGNNNETAIGQARVTLSTASSTLKLRKSPSSSAAVLTTMANGMVVDLLADEGAWLKVRTPSGVTGYASAAYLRVLGNGTTSEPTATATATAAPTATNAPADDVVATGVITGSSVNVRSGPSTSATKLGSLKLGNSVEIVAQNSGFYKIIYGNGYGYVSGSYVKVTGNVETPAPTDTPTATPAPTGTTAPTATTDPSMPMGQAYISIDGTALMGSPSGSVIYEYLSRNTRVTVLSTEGGYCYVRTANGDLGYVAASAVATAGTETAAPSESAQPTQNPGNTATEQKGSIKLSSSSSTLNLRAQPSTSSGIVASLKHGASVTVTGESGDWYAITAGGNSGYVMKKYVRVSSDTDTGNDNTGSDTTTKVFPATIKLGSASSTVNVRAGAGTNTTKLGSLKNGASVNIVASKGDWYKIEYGTGYGYVLKSYVRLNGSDSSGSDSSGSSSSGSSSTATTTTSVNLRAKGTTASDKLGTFAKGTKVTVLDKGSSWSKVEVSGKTGYMLNSYLKFK